LQLNRVLIMVTASDKMVPASDKMVPA